jgi:hypothetical protein
MCRRLLSTVALAAVFALGACSEQQQKTATGPEFAGGPPPGPTDCDFSLVRTLVNSYFTSPLQQDAKSLEQQMETAGSRTSNAIQRGFDIMTLIGRASREGTPSTTVGSNLTKALMRCMFDVGNTTNFPGFPNDFDFAPALTELTGGAYYVRGGPSDATSTVVAADFSGSTPNNLSAVAPAGTATWPGILAGNALSADRALFYGSVVGLSPLVYDWKTMPPNTAFGSSGALVGVCDGNVGSSALVNESSLGFLPYASADGICAADQPVAMIESGWGPLALMRRAAHWSAELLTPQALQATVVGKTGSGGTSTGFKSKFKTTSLTSPLTVKFVAGAPPSKVKLNTPFTVSVTVTGPADPGFPSAVLNACVYVTGANNNGTPTQLLGDTDPRCDSPPTPDARSAVTGAGGVASLSAHVTKNGGLVLTATVKVIDRPAVTGGVATAKTNVGP